MTLLLKYIENNTEFRIIFLLTIATTVLKESTQQTHARSHKRRQTHVCWEKNQKENRKNPFTVT